MSQALIELSDYLTEVKADLIERAEIAFGDLTVYTQADKIVELMTFLRDDAQCKFVCFIDCCGVDWPGRADRFEVVYHLLSPHQNSRIRVSLSTSEDIPVPSVTGVFPGADWFEREAYDLYGILFSGHEPVELRQEFRDFDFLSPWEGTDYVLPGDEKAKG